MALVDFYQLVVQYKLHCADTSFLPTISQSLPVSTTLPPSPAPPVEPDQASSSLPPSAQTLPKTPERGSGAVRNLPDTGTPRSCSPSEEGDPEQVSGYKCGECDRCKCGDYDKCKYGEYDKYKCGLEYDEYIHEDLNSRVFVDLEVFMKSVLHVPDDWKTIWGPAIEAVKKDPNFYGHHERYHWLCSGPSSAETSFYESLVKTANAALDVLSQPKLESTPGLPRRYHGDDTKKLQGGVMNRVGLFPDPLHILGVKPCGDLLCGGENMPRLAVDGIDPILNHASVPCPSRHKQKGSSPLTTPVTDSGSTPSQPRKRPAEGSHSRDNGPPKESKTESMGKSALVQGSDGGSDAETEEEDEGSSMQTTELGIQVDLAPQVCRYLLEMFSVPLLRSHTTVGLVDRNRLQLYHANCSVILVSSAINFSDGDGLDKFIAVIIAFQRLSFEQSGILNTHLDGNTELVKGKDVLGGEKVTRKGHRLKLPTSGAEEGRFVVTLGEVISRHPAIVGRSTVVLKASSDKWQDENLVIKVSYPDSGRVPENEFLEKADEEAKQTEGEWATKHLPRVFYFEDVDPSKDPTLESVACLFKDAQFATGKRHVYERLTLRIIIQEELHPLGSLTNARDVGQVFLDVACIHRWLYDKPGILHRDLSLRNIMCRIIEETNVDGERERKVYGVLMDYDLSSWTKDLNNGLTGISQQCTGTPPYMASELLRETGITHLYRHDLESLFYIMLLVCGRYTLDDVEDSATMEVTRKVVKRRGNLPYQEWFDYRNYKTLGVNKDSFILEMENIQLSPPFKDFHWWLGFIQLQFSEGFAAKRRTKRNELAKKYDIPSLGEDIPFDEETMGGHVTYSSIIEITRRLKGELEGLSIRYQGETATPHSSLS